VVVGLCVSGAQLVSPNPVRTIVHEFIHASCGRTKEVVASPAFLATGSTGVTITAGGEKERKLQTVQPEVGENLKSAYAYAQFVMDVSGS
jgi:hypothetical protein